MAKTNKYSIINNEMFMYELEPFVIENVPSGIDTIYVQEEKFDEYKQLNPSLPLAKKNYLLLCANTPVWYSDYQRVMQLPDIASPELSFSASEASVNVYEVPCVIELAAVTNPHNVDVVYSVDGVEVLDPSACEITTDGSHTVTASFAGNDYYYSMEVSYALTINIVEDTMYISFANSEVNVSSYLDETWTGQLQPVVGAPSGATISYSCEGGVIENGNLTLPSAGTYTVNVEVSATHYTTATASYDIVYTQDYRTMNISFTVDSIGVAGNQGESWTGTVQAVSGAPQGATVEYSCSDANVTISGTSIEIADEGTYTITATVSANYYNTATASYSIVYSQNDLVMNLSFANSAISETLTEGDGYEAQVQAVTGAPQDSTIVYSASTGSINNGVLTLSSVSDSDVVTVTATVSCPDYVTTTISYTISFTVLSIMDAYFANDVDVNTYVDETYTGALQAVTDAPQGATITYSCENGTIANGQITLSSAGTYTVYAEISCSGYVTKTISYSIVYTQSNRTMNLSFTNSAISETISGDSYSAQVQAVTGAPQGATIVYSTSAGSISNGTLTVSSISDNDVVTVTATVSATGYTTATASYTITFTVQSQQMDISFEEDTVTHKAYDIYWSGEPQAVTGAPTGATIEYSSEDSGISVGDNQGQPWYSTNNEGTYTITATVSADGYETTSISYDLVCEYCEQYRLTAYDSENYMISSYVSDFDGNGNSLNTINIQEEMDSEYETWYKPFAITSRLDINEPQAANDYNDSMEVAQRDGYDAGDSENITISQGAWSNSRTTVYTSANVSNLGNITFYDENEGSYVALEDLLSSYAVVDSNLTYVDTNVSDANLTPHFGLVIENDYNKVGYNLVRFQIDKMDDMDNSIVEEANAIEMFVLVYVAKSVSFAAQKSNLNVSFAQNEYNYSPLGAQSVEPIIGIPNDYDGTITWDYSTDEVNWTPVQNDLIGDTRDAVVYVRATLPDTSLYNGTQIQYTVTRWTDYADILWEGTGITSTTFYFDSEDNPSFPVSVTPIDAPTTNGVSVDSITSSDTSILEIDSNTGEWILKQEGTVTMTATVNDVIQSEYRMCGDTKDLTVTIDIVSGRVETQFMQSSASDVNMIEYVESDLTQSQLPYTITISDVYLQTTQGTAVTLSDSSLIVHDCGPDFSFDNDNNEVTYTAWQLSDMVQATLTFKGDATYKPCSATVYIELNEVILPSYTLSYTYDDTNMTATCTGADDTTLTDIEIPAQVEYNGDTYDVTSVGANAFMQYSLLRNLTLHEGLLTIESQAFKEPDIYYLVIPDSVTTIGNSAFWSGSDYHTITFGTGLTSVGGSNFVNCQTYITDIYCRMSTPFTIASYTFYGLSKGNITLHVPVGSLATYQANSWWGSGWSSIVDDIVIS